MGKTILYISYDGLTDPLGQSQVIPYLAGLAAREHIIHVVSAEKKDRFAAGSSFLRRRLKEMKIHWHPVSYSNKYPGLSAYLTYRRLRSEAVQLLISSRPHIVHCRSYIPALIGLEFKKESAIKFLFDMRGFWADERVEGGIWNMQHWWYRKAYDFFKRKEAAFLSASDAIISLTENARMDLLQRHLPSLTAEKITVIPCCADLDFFSEKNAAPNRIALRNEIGIGAEDYILCYAGSVGSWYLLKEMLQFYKHLHDILPAAKFLIITLDNPELIRQQASQLQLPPGCLFIRESARIMMPRYLSIANAAVFFIKNSFSKKASSPTKMGEFMSMGIPMVCNAGIGDVDSIMQTTQAGIVLSALDDASMKEGAARLLNTTFSRQAIISAAQYYSLKKGIQLYHQVYTSC